MNRVMSKITEKPVEAIANQIVCDGRLKASVILDDKHIVEVVENEQVHYKPLGSQEWKLRKRGRLAQKLANSDKQYSSYNCISYVELENARDEREFLDMITAKILADIRKA